MSMMFGRLALLGIVLGAGVSLSACETFSEATGSTKIVPDEFAVVTKAPLVVPPDFNLRPPQPGAPDRTPDPSATARAALFPQPGVDTLGPNYSGTERQVLTNANAANADPNIRSTISSEAGYQEGGPDLTNRVLNAPAQPAEPSQ